MVLVGPTFCGLRLSSWDLIHHPKNPWTLQWKGLNLYSRGPGPRNSHFWGVRILRALWIYKDPYKTTRGFFSRLACQKTTRGNVHLQDLYLVPSGQKRSVFLCRSLLGGGLTLVYFYQRRQPWGNDIQWMSIQNDYINIYKYIYYILYIIFIKYILYIWCVFVWNWVGSTTTFMVCFGELSFCCLNSCFPRLAKYWEPR